MRMLVLFKSDGVQQTPDDEGVYTLANATTYYAEFREDIDDCSVFSVHWKYNAALVAAITIEASNRPEHSVTSYAATGSGWVATGATTISPAASAGEALPQYADFAAFRGRAKIDVTTGGTLSGFEHSKQRDAR
jgi:hypothetical protein